MDDDSGVFHFDSVLTGRFVAPWRWPVLVYAWAAFTLVLLTPWGEGQGVLLAVLAGIVAAVLCWVVQQRVLRRRQDRVWEGFGPLRERLQQEAQAKRAVAPVA